MAEYVQKDGLLTTNIPLATVGTLCWQNQFFCRDADLVIVNNRALAGFHAEFVCKVIDCFNRIST